MTWLTLIPWATTEWQSSGRLASRTPLPLSQEGRTQADSWGRTMAERGLSTVYSSKNQTGIETAELVARSAEMRVKQSSELAEIDLGLWEGLTEQQLVSRYPKLFKKWQLDPASVAIPDGESFEEAGERLGSKLRQLIKKNREKAAGVVLGPLALAVGRCELEGVPLDRLRELMSNEPVWYEFDASGKRVVLVSGRVGA